jgi:hypothetical protein
MIGLVFYLVIIILKKKTNLLKVDGRKVSESYLPNTLSTQNQQLSEDEDYKDAHLF